MAQDDFNRADSGSLGANWTDVQGTMGILSNTAVGKTAGTYNISKWNAGAAAADQWSQATISALTAGSGQTGIVTRGQGAGSFSGYLFWTNGSALRIYRLDSGTFNQIADFGGSAAVNDIIKGDSTGNTHTFYKNSVSQGSQPDGTYTSNLVVG